MRFEPLPDDVDLRLRPDANGNIVAVIYSGPWDDELRPRPKSSRTIAREKAKTAEAERVAAEAAKLRSQVHRSLKPLSGRLWSLHADALLVVGPGGGIPIPASAVAVLEPLASGGRHALQERDRTALDALAPRLAVVGLRIDRRSGSVRIARTKLGANCSEA